MDRKKWGLYPRAQQLIKEVEEKIAEAYKALGKSDEEKKQKDKAKAEEEDRELDDKIASAVKDVGVALKAGKCSYR